MRDHPDGSYSVVGLGSSPHHQPALRTPRPARPQSTVGCSWRSRCSGVKSLPGAVILAAPFYALAGAKYSPVPATLTAALAAAGPGALLYKVLFASSLGAWLSQGLFCSRRRRTGPSLDGNFGAPGRRARHRSRNVVRAQAQLGPVRTDVRSGHLVPCPSRRWCGGDVHRRSSAAGTQVAPSDHLAAAGAASLIAFLAWNRVDGTLHGHRWLLRCPRQWSGPTRLPGQRGGNAGFPRARHSHLFTHPPPGLLLDCDPHGGARRRSNASSPWPASLTSSRSSG